MLQKKRLVSPFKNAKSIEKILTLATVVMSARRDPMTNIENCMVRICFEMQDRGRMCTRLNGKMKLGDCWESYKHNSSHTAR